MRTLLFGLALLTAYALPGQSSLASKNTELIGLIGEVQSGRDVFEQELTFDESAPYRLQLFVTEIDQRGNEERREYQLNLALIDPNLVRWSDGRDRIEVNLRSGRDKVVKVFEDGELDGYESEAAILATDVDNARAMEALLKEMIPLAREAWESDTSLPEDYDALKKWVADHLGNVAIGDDSYEQQWINADDHPNRMRFVLTETDSRNSSTTIYDMNLADIHPPSIEVNVRGKEVTIELQTAQRADFIRVEEDGEQRNYTNSLSLHCAEVDEAQTMAYALRQLIPKAQATEESMQPATADPATATEALQELLTEFKQDDTSIRQSLDGTCEVTYTRIEDDGEAEEQQFIFNFADLQPNKVEIDVRGTAIEVTVETAGGENFIYVSKNGEQQNYADDLSFPAPDIPSAKLIRHYLVQLIEQCPKEIAPADWEGIQAAIAEAETYAEGLFQQVELLEGDACKWGLTVQEEGSRRSSEERYEFNLYDLDARRMELAVRGKDVSINLFTLRNDEIIKNYTDGEELGYEKEVSFRVKDIATGKAVIAGLQVLIGGCEE